MLLELLAAASMQMAVPEMVYLVDTHNWSVHHCKCVHLPDFHEYCSDGWEWRLYSRWQIQPTEEAARAYLKMDLNRQIDTLQRKLKTTDNESVWGGPGDVREVEGP